MHASIFAGYLGTEGQDAAQLLILKLGWLIITTLYYPYQP